MVEIDRIRYADLRPDRGHVVAEVACGHEGQFDRIQQLVEVAVDGGAQLIKYQIF